MLLSISRYRSAKLLFQCAHLGIMLLSVRAALLRMVVEAEQVMGVLLLIVKASGM